MILPPNGTPVPSLPVLGGGVDRGRPEARADRAGPSPRSSLPKACVNRGRAPQPTLERIDGEGVGTARREELTALLDRARAGTARDRRFAAICADPGRIA